MPSSSRRPEVSTIFAILDPSPTALPVFIGRAIWFSQVCSTYRQGWRARRPGNKKLGVWARTVGVENVRFMPLETCPHEEAWHRQQVWVTQLRREGVELFNIACIDLDEQERENEEAAKLKLAPAIPQPSPGPELPATARPKPSKPKTKPRPTFPRPSVRPHPDGWIVRLRPDDPGTVVSTIPEAWKLIRGFRPEPPGL